LEEPHKQITGARDMDDEPKTLKLETLDFGKIERFTVLGGPVAGGCTLEGQAWPKNWECSIGGTIFKCDGNGYWVNQRSGN
jgi:hypothetical protein